MPTHKPKFIVIDGNALLHRAWHALPPTMQTKTGEVVNAVYGFTMILLKVLKDLKPEYLAVTFDLKGPTFRHEEYKEYKATRIKKPDELYQQIPKIKDVVRAFNIPIYEKSGFEADDVIATLVRNKAVEKLKSVIVTGDLDTLQLVDENTEIYTMHKGISDTVTYDINEVKRRFDGLTPEQMVDYKALRGDPSDNIPGVKGIGEKGAITLLKEFKTLENLYKNLGSKKISERNRALLTEQRGAALLSKQLATMANNVPIAFSLAETRVGKFDSAKIVQLLHRLEFRSLLSKLPKEMVAEQPRRQSTFGFDGAESKKGVNVQGATYTLVDTPKKFADFLAQLQQQPSFTFDTETTGLNPLEDKLLGISVCWQEGRAFYVVAKPEWLKMMAPIFENDRIKKQGHNIKFDMLALQSSGVSVRGVDCDTMIASYLINPGSRQHNLDGLVFSELGYQMQPITELIGKGKAQITMAGVPLEQVADYACEDADFTFRLVAPLRQQLAERNNLGLLEKIELPLVPVLAEMEKNGILIDTKFLQAMSK